jgi:septal ring factor EnvC (AmiA/AmiB activator)
MKKRISLTVAVFLVIFTAIPYGFSQKKSGGSSARIDSELASLTTSLNLTSDEQAKIRPILEDEHAKIHAIRKDASVSKDDQKAKNKTIRDGANQQIRALLTPDQQQTFDGLSKKGQDKNGSSSPAAPGL